MKPIHLLGVDEGPESFAALVAAARRLGLRVGWLDLARRPEVPAALGSAVAAGAFRAVAATDGGTVSVKRVPAGPRLDDLLREHFLGCRLVLVRGEGPAARLEARGDGWRIRRRPEGAGRPLDLSTAELARRLRRPAATFLAD